MAFNNEEKDSKALLKTVNNLLGRVNIHARVGDIRDVSSLLLVDIWEQLCSEKLEDVIRKPQNRKDNARNLEVLIDAVSRFLNLPLSHISAEELASGNHRALSNFLEIFDGFVKGQYTVGRNEDDVVKLANSLLDKLNVSYRVRNVKDITSSLLVEIMEGICMDLITGTVIPPKNIDDELRNVQTVLRILEDVLSTSLSHINAMDVIRHNEIAIGSLLEVISSVIEDPPAIDSSITDDSELVNLANEVLSRLGIETSVRTFQDINSLLFVRMLDQICEGKLKDVICGPNDSEIHNLTVIIATLSDILMTSLSHISPQEVASGNRVATKHLLEVFYGLLEGLTEDTIKETNGTFDTTSLSREQEELLVKMANDLLSKLDVDQRVKSAHDINASFFVRLLEDICSEQLQGSLQNPRTSEENLYNLQLVIITLEDIHKVPLTHISALDVVGGHFVATKNLLEIFAGLVNAPLKRTSDVSEAAVLQLVNSLLAKLNTSFRVNKLHELTATLFVSIFEQFCPDGLTGIIRHPVRTEDEVQNMKIILETLENLLKTSLSHIPPSGIVFGNRLVLRNLLELLLHLANEQETRTKPTNAADDGIVNFANDLLLPLNLRINSVEDIDSLFFVKVLEQVFMEKINDVIQKPRTQEDDVHNVRVVLKTLADQLQVPLSHIDPLEVVLGNRLAIGHLLEVFSELPRDIESSNGQSRDNRDDDSDIIEQTNEMLSKLHIGAKIRSIHDFTSTLFVTLFEGLCAETLPDVIRHPVTEKDEVHNVQMVINTLSSDVLNTSLSHITGQRIVNGDRMAVVNLVEVLYGLMKYILEEISDDSRFRPGSRDENRDDDPDLINPSLFRGILQSELNKSTHAYKEKSGFGERLKLGETSQPLSLHDQLMHRRESDLERSLRQRSGLKSSERRLDESRLQGSSLSNGATSYSRRNHQHSSSGLLAESPTKYDPSSKYPSQQLNYASDLTNQSIEIPRIAPSHNDDFRSRTLMESGLSNISSKNVRVLTSAVRSDDRETDVTEFRHGDPSIMMNPEISLPDMSSSFLLEHSKNQTRLKQRIPADKRLDVSSASVSVPKVPDQSIRPETYKDYLLKYYGRESRHPDLRNMEDIDSLSDGFIDYNHSRSGGGSFQQELEGYQQKLEKKAAAFDFDDCVENCAVGPLSGLRRRIKNENKATLKRKEFLGKVYHDELAELEQEALFETKRTSENKDKAFRRQVFKQPQTARYKTKKYSAPVGVLIARSRVGQRSVSRNRKRCASASPTIKGPTKVRSNDVLSHLLEEFPSLHLTPSTAYNLSRKASQQKEQLRNVENDILWRKSKAQGQIEDAERRQRVLLNIMKKDLTQKQQLKESKDRQQCTVAAKAKIRDKRLQSARIRKYYDEFHVGQRSRMLKKRTKEELLFQRLFNDTLSVQKDRILELKKYSKEQREQRDKKLKQELESLENFYKDQFAMLTEELEKEENNAAIRDKAQTKVLEDMKRELRKKMEKEIRELQRQLRTDEDDIYFRELCAERARRDLSLAQYKLKI